MKKFLFVIIFICMTNFCFGVEAFCEFSKSQPGSNYQMTETIEYLALNGDCCNPSPGYGLYTTILDYGSYQEWGSVPMSTQHLATLNPNCVIYE